MTMIAITDIHVDQSIYPRSMWSEQTVTRYAEAIEAGERFPAIILEQGTNRLLDGMHRLLAHKQLGLAEIDAEYHELPSGEHVKLYAAGLSARNGDRITGRDLQAVVTQVVRERPDYSMVAIARHVGVTRQTISKWAAPIIERRREIRKVRALLLSRLGWSLRKSGEVLGIDEATVRSDVKDDIFPHLTEELLQEAIDGEPWGGSDIDFSSVLEQIREELIFASWSDDERVLLKRLRDGETIVVSLREHHANLVAWAESAKLFVRVDRRTEWGNPFEMPADGDRHTVIHNYEQHYLPQKPSLLAKLPGLPGKALGCWCAPELCHGDVLKRWVERGDRSD